ncbi:MAG: A24 family peptidase C-terminal domain-containing protein [Archaeoglobaceae archaeon]
MIAYYYLFKIIVALPFLIYACKVDLKERRVPNKLWKYMLVVFVPIVLIEFFLTQFNVFIALIQFSVIFVLAYALHYTGLWGGADAKALTLLAVAFPVYPQLWFMPALNQGFGILAFSTLSNAVVFSPAVVLYVFLKNLRHGVREGKLLHYFTGYRVDADRIPPFHNLLEYFNDGKLKRVNRGIEPYDKILADLKKAKEKGKIDKIWVTPGLPFLVFITAGFMISILVGDILLEIIMKLLV